MTPQVFHPESDITPLDYNQIFDWVFLGTNQCCQNHFAEELLTKGITVDVSLEQEHLDMPIGVEVFLWLPTPDLTAPTRDALENGIALLRDVERQNRKVYIHCKNGHGRAPALLAAYLIVEKGMTPDDAIALIQTARPTIHLQEPQRERLYEMATAQ
jgi:protein-tyrosine phosphatase